MQQPRLYLADGETQTIAGRRAPSVIGPCDRLSWGAVVVLRPGAVPAGGPPVRFGVPSSAGWRILGRSRKDFRVLTHPGDRAELRRAADAVIRTLDHGAALRNLLDSLQDLDGTLAGALWDLAGVLEERGRVRHDQAQLAGDVPADDAARAEVRRRAARMTALDADAAARSYYLTHLADEAEALARAVDSAHAAVRDAKAARLPVDAEPMLAAYRDLTR